MENDLPKGLVLDEPVSQDGDSDELPKGLVLDEEKYGDIPHQIGAAVIGAGEGFLGPVAPAIARAVGVSPEEYRLTKEINPVTHGVSEALSFGASMLAGTGEAALLAKAGEALSGATKAGKAVEWATQLGEVAPLAQRMAAGATKAGAELALMQSGNEITKAITEDPDQTIGSAATNIGLSGLLGAASSPLLIGAGAGIKSGLDKIGLKEFSDRLAYRGANANPNEAIHHEIEGAVNKYYEMGSEVSGVHGLKAKAIEKFMPEMNEKISNQLNGVIGSLEGVASKMESKPATYGSQVPGIIRENVLDLQNALQENATPGKIFEELNNLKKNLDLEIPFGTTHGKAYSELHEVNNIIRKGLEDKSVWGEVGSIQKEINSAWSKAIPAAKDMRTFMSKIGGKWTIDPTKIESFVNQAGKKEYDTVRQKKLRSFIDSIENFQKTMDGIYEKVGVESPIEPIAMGAMKEALGKPSVGSKLADLWYDKLGAQSIGGLSGALAGNAISPGLAGAFIGKEVLGPVFGALLQPLAEKTANLTAYQQAMKFGKSVVDGNNKLINAASEVFSSGAKPVLLNAIPDDKKIKDLDEKLQKFENNPQDLLNVSGELAHYAPAHSESLAKTTANAVNYLNQQRPKPMQLSPLDSKIEPTKAQKLSYERTLAVTQNPLSALKYLKDGTLIPSDIKTLKTIYPAYYNKVSQELMSAMTNHISKGETIPYKTRQSLSLFLGQPLDSTMTPASIQAIQSMYIGKKQQIQQAAQQQHPKKNTSKLGEISKNMLTSTQKAEENRMKK